MLGVLELLVAPIENMLCSMETRLVRPLGITMSSTDTIAIEPLVVTPMALIYNLHISGYTFKTFPESIYQEFMKKNKHEAWDFLEDIAWKSVSRIILLKSLVHRHL